MAQEYPVAQGPTPGAPASTDLMAFFPPAPSTDPPVTRTVADVGIGRVRALSHVTHAGDQTFSTSAYAADATPALDAEADGVIVMWEIPADNLGASTLAVNGLPARNLAHFPDGQAMGAGDLPRTGVVISILRNHTWYTFGLHTRWADILDRPSIMPEAEAKAGTAATERTISAIRLKAAIESLADAPQDELKAVLRVLAQKAGAHQNMVEQRAHLDGGRGDHFERQREDGGQLPIDGSHRARRGRFHRDRVHPERRGCGRDHLRHG